jgi:hypothetical protein
VGPGKEEDRQAVSVKPSKGGGQGRSGECAKPSRTILRSCDASAHRSRELLHPAQKKKIQAKNQQLAVIRRQTSECTTQMKKNKKNKKNQVRELLCTRPKEGKKKERAAIDEATRGRGVTDGGSEHEVERVRRRQHTAVLGVAHVEALEQLAQRLHVVVVHLGLWGRGERG